MVFVIYKTTNVVTGRFYVGKWSAEDAQGQSYLGSGRALRTDIRRYGRAAFRRETLFVFDTPDAAIAKERGIVTKEFCARPDTYNLAVGGSGSFVHVRSDDRWIGSEQHRQQQRVMSASTRSKRSQTLKQRWATDPEARERHRQGIARSKRERGHWGASTHTPSVRRQLSAAMKAQAAAGRHPCLGTRWMSKNGEVAKVPQRQLAQRVKDGWSFGRS